MRALLAAGLALAALTAVAAEIAPEARRSGHDFASPEIRAMQDDETANPGMLWVLQGESLWARKAGAAANSCQDCHGDAGASMKGVAARYPAFDAVLARAAREGLSHQQFLHLLLADQAAQRRERSIARRIGEARFRDPKPLPAFDWEFNRAAIDRTQIEELATGAFIRRRDNLVLVGQSGVGKSFLIEAIGLSACALGLSVRLLLGCPQMPEL